MHRFKRGLALTVHVIWLLVLASAFVVVYALRVGWAMLLPRGESRADARQRALGRTLREALMSLGVTWIKLGQVLSARPDIFSRPVIEELQPLQDRVAPMPSLEARALVMRELGPATRSKIAHFEPTPIGAASVAQVHRATLETGDDVAIKLVRPGARARIERDAILIAWFASIVELVPGRHTLRPRDLARDFVTGLRAQTDLLTEAENYRIFSENFAGFEGVHFPRVYDELTTSNVMTMEFIVGEKVRGLPRDDGKEIADRLQDAFFKMCFEDGFVHADLHPGNVLIEEDGKLAIFDVGLIKRISPRVLPEMMDLTRCIAIGDVDDFVEHVRTFHERSAGTDWAAFRDDIEGLLRRIRGKRTDELDMPAIIFDLFRIGRRHGVRPMDDITLVLVSTVTAEGITKVLDPSHDALARTATYFASLASEKEPGGDTPDGSSSFVAA